jgi:hypothetical protein
MKPEHLAQEREDAAFGISPEGLAEVAVDLVCMLGVAAIDAAVASLEIGK